MKRGLIILEFLLLSSFALADLGEPGQYSYDSQTGSFDNSWGTFIYTVYYPTTGQNHPTVIFSPGYGASNSNYMTYASYGQHLASHGYVALISSVPSSSFDLQMRVDGFISAAEHLIAENSGSGSLSGKIDTNKIAAMGHSYGGAATIQVQSQTDLIKVGVGLAAYTEAVTACDQVNNPIKLIVAESDSISNTPRAQTCFDSMPSDTKEFDVHTGLTHFSFQKPNSAVKESYTSWLETHLRGGSGPVCGDGNCDSGETCVSDECCNGNNYNPSSQRCCSGTVRTGDCCSVTDCTGSDICDNYVCTPAGPSCGDGNCDPGETCTADNCCNGNTYISSSQLCCSGTVRAGDCCSVTDCTGSDTCDNYVCTPPGTTTECSDGTDNDGDGQVDLVDSGCDNADDNDETDCGDGQCEGGEQCDVCSDCGACGSDIIVDNRDDGTSHSGYWRRQTYYSGFYGTDYHYSPDRSNQWFEWTSTLSPGTYEISAWWVESSRRPTDAIYRITHATGSTDVIVNQQTNGGQWNSLGSFNLQDTGTVRLLRGSDGAACADAIKFTPAGSNCGTADKDSSGRVTMLELSEFFVEWRSGSSTIEELITAISQWKNGC